MTDTMFAKKISDKNGIEQKKQNISNKSVMGLDKRDKCGVAAY